MGRSRVSRCSRWLGTNPCGAVGVLDITRSNGDSRYSRALFALGAGTHAIRIDIIRNAANTTFGQAVFQVTQASAGVPEPDTILLMGAGLLGLAVLRRRLSWCCLSYRSKIPEEQNSPFGKSRWKGEFVALRRKTLSPEDFKEI